MSGTSLDGLDIALCEFDLDQKWNYKIVRAVTIQYSQEMKNALSSIATGTALDLVKLNTSFGKFCGLQVAEFLKDGKEKIDFVASHGHTVFHQPLSGYTLQIGDGASLSAACGLPVVCDFRSLDVALGGQGAPLVPIGDQLLFGEYTYCLNLGGISNISFENSNKRFAFDICFCNIILNYLAQKKNLPYDNDGAIAARGLVDENLLKDLDQEEFYKMTFPKSLGREDVDKIILKFFESNKYNLSIEDQMSTALEHIGKQIGRYAESGTLLLTGGGAFNSELVKRIKKYSKAEVIIPNHLLVNYKEALIFAFLGLKRWRGETNCLMSVTGASKDNTGGAIFLS